MRRKKSEIQQQLIKDFLEIVPMIFERKIKNGYSSGVDTYYILKKDSSSFECELEIKLYLFCSLKIRIINSTGEVPYEFMFDLNRKNFDSTVELVLILINVFNSI